ncbi:MAG: HAD family hydrolase [Ignavibacteria bacterium]|nr:HAD family hydrolase [Ignavibacteria bacterium]
MECAVFLDRDGTIIKERNYLTNISQIKPVQGVKKALFNLKKSGYLNIIITNQSAVARGLITEKKLREIHNYLISNLTYHRKKVIDDIYYSPFHKDGTISRYKIEHPDRKPGTGMIQKAVKKHTIDLQTSYFVGDSLSDMQCAQNAGLKKILVLTGYGRRTLEICRKEDIRLEYTAKNISDAANYILSQK